MVNAVANTANKVKPYYRLWKNVEKLNHSEMPLLNLKTFLVQTKQNKCQPLHLFIFLVFNYCVLSKEKTYIYKKRHLY